MNITEHKIFNNLKNNTGINLVGIDKSFKFTPDNSVYRCTDLVNELENIRFHIEVSKVVYIDMTNLVIKPNDNIITDIFMALQYLSFEKKKSVIMFYPTNKGEPLYSQTPLITVKTFVNFTDENNYVCIKDRSNLFRTAINNATILSLNNKSEINNSFIIESVEFNKEFNVIYFLIENKKVKIPFNMDKIKTFIITYFIYSCDNRPVANLNDKALRFYYSFVNLLVINLEKYINQQIPSTLHLFNYFAHEIKKVDLIKYESLCNLSNGLTLTDIEVNKEIGW